ncbi:hypothetical protein [Anaerocolumna xylanovorans]|uniref:Short chain dehydrogenase n=1 Tax=Anaerocolumna xylanovorans DSM 12503 TaxID=1121345 RepID=A0A1M7YIG2_9FIRM|nr:hypothetical protein [Anaerocolumna xylanovorans]SHO52379.1 hypothetical protein SAMN02745217_03619 [Anaerocolumna xylanovorans DSM 12503]
MENSSHIIIDPKERDGKRVLVTGGTKRGMGEAIVTRLTQDAIVIDAVLAGE